MSGNERMREKNDARFAEMQRDYVEQLEAKDEELDRACALLLNIEGAILGYWTDMPQNVLEDFRVRIREFLGDWEPVRTSAAAPPGAPEAS